MEGTAALERAHSMRQELESAVVRFAGDSGDGMQLTGTRFTDTGLPSGERLTWY